MSLFGNLVRTDGTTKSDLDFRELPIFSYKNLVDKEEIGVGAFTVVFPAKLPDESKVVVKNLISADKETKKSLVKEARFLQNLRDANVVEFKGYARTSLLYYWNMHILISVLLDVIFRLTALLNF